MLRTGRTLHCYIYTRGSYSVLQIRGPSTTLWLLPGLYWSTYLGFFFQMELFQWPRCLYYKTPTCDSFIVFAQLTSYLNLLPAGLLKGSLYANSKCKLLFLCSHQSSLAVCSGVNHISGVSWHCWLHLFIFADTYLSAPNASHKLRTRWTCYKVDQLFFCYKPNL